MEKYYNYDPHNLNEMRELYRELRFKLAKLRPKLRLLEKEKRSKKLVLNTAGQEKYKNKEFKTLKEMEIWVEGKMADINKEIADVEAQILEISELIQALKNDIDLEKSERILTMQEEKDLAFNE